MENFPVQLIKIDGKTYLQQRKKRNIITFQNGC